MAKYLLSGILIVSGLGIGCLGAYVMLYYVYADSGRSFHPTLLFTLTAVLEGLGLFLPFLLRHRQYIINLKILLWSILAIQIPTVLFLIYGYLAYRFT